MLTALLDLFFPNRDSARALSLLTDIREELRTMNAALDTLTAEVTENASVVESAVALLSGLSAALREAIAANDPAALTDLANRLDAQTNELAAAVAANTLASE